MTDPWLIEPFPNNHNYREPELMDPLMRMSFPDEEIHYGHPGSSGIANAFHVSLKYVDYVYDNF
jgi:hypothetical protein